MVVASILGKSGGQDGFFWFGLVCAGIALLAHLAWRGIPLDADQKAHNAAGGLVVLGLAGALVFGLAWISSIP